MTAPLLSFRQVGFSYGPQRPVLRDVNFQLYPGQRVGLIGPIGSGKTTLLHLAVGLLRPTAGQIEAFGRARRKESDFFEVRARVGLLFQDSDDQLFCPTVAEDVAFGPLNLGHNANEAAARVAETLDLLELSGYEQRITHQLSSGEKRMIALAGVLAMKPQVLLLDEPVAGLDEHFEQRVTEVLDRLHPAMLIVSHDPAFLANVTHETIRLHEHTLHSSDPAAPGRS